MAGQIHALITPRDRFALIEQYANSHVLESGDHTYCHRVPAIYVFSRPRSDRAPLVIGVGVITGTRDAKPEANRSVKEARDAEVYGENI
jgi:hypothetical protein